MSLRDQLVAKGLASKKDKRKADQTLRLKRRKNQGSKRKKRQLEAQQAAERLAAEEALLERRAAALRDIAQARSHLERKQRVFAIIRANEIRSRGRIRFHHPDLEGRFIKVMELSYSVAISLRRGHAAIVGFDHGGQADYRVVSAGAATDLRELAPEAVVFQVRDTTGLPNPSEEFWSPEQAIDLRPHRARPQDIARLQQRA